MEGLNEFRTSSGRMINPIDMTAADVDINDIAHSLARQNRYGGHGNIEDYSVAEHSVLVCRRVWSMKEDNELALAALLHDGTECYCQDLMRPIKKEIGGQYRVMEGRIAMAICEKFSINQTHWCDPIIKQIDDQICDDEKMALWPDIDHSSRKPLGIKINGWTPRKAQSHFLSTFYALHYLTRRHEREA